MVLVIRSHYNDGHFLVLLHEFKGKHFGVCVNECVLKAKIKLRNQRIRLQGSDLNTSIYLKEKEQIIDRVAGPNGLFLNDLSLLIFSQSLWSV